MAIRGRLARRPAQKNVGQAEMLNSVARNGPPHNPRGLKARRSRLAHLQNYMFSFFSSHIIHHVVSLSSFYYYYYYYYKTMILVHEYGISFYAFLGTCLVR